MEIPTSEVDDIKIFKSRKIGKASKLRYSVSSWTSKSSRALKSMFLPEMEVLPDGFVSYSIWNAVQDLSTQLRGVLATQRVLEGIGVGREGATAISATINFIIRDGAGMAASLVFSALFVEFLKTLF